MSRPSHPLFNRPQEAQGITVLVCPVCRIVTATVTCLVSCQKFLITLRCWLSTVQLTGCYVATLVSASQEPDVCSRVGSCNYVYWWRGAGSVMLFWVMCNNRGSTTAVSLITNQDLNPLIILMDAIFERSVPNRWSGKLDTAAGDLVLWLLSGPLGGPERSGPLPPSEAPNHN